MKVTAQGKIEASNGKVFEVSDFADEYHPGHPDDELPPMRPRSFAAKVAKMKEVQ